ncbi:uncharacterized protein LOC123918715 isoform X5 [Trifolium pratense]|uniref:uncharacterized protein LOC123918715 isoform X5 n=1 Tax=Trifolium pratense TaxID=57577 RepID=UPI001E698093|nr:uncharacterized protein LOC123918715 isoform X5 [Trifolium pratense]
MELTLLLTQLLRLDVNNFLKEDPTSFDKETREGKSLWCLWALSQTQEGLLLLEELVNSFDGEGFLAIIDASKQWFNESQVIKVECNASWWRIREDTLFALSSLSEQLLETHVCDIDFSFLNSYGLIYMLKIYISIFNIWVIFCTEIYIYRSAYLLFFVV